MTVIVPGSGGQLEVEMYWDDADDEEPSIMLSATPQAPQTTYFALSPAAARRVIQALEEQLKAHDQWKAARVARARLAAHDQAKKEQK